MSSTDGMSSDYDEHSEYQRRVVDDGADVVERCVAAIPLPQPPSPVVVVDLGAGTGRALRERPDLGRWLRVAA